MPSGGHTRLLDILAVAETMALEQWNGHADCFMFFGHDGLGGNDGPVHHGLDSPVCP